MEFTGSETILGNLSVPGGGKGKPEAIKAPSAKILIVEDDPDNLTLASYVVEELGYLPIVASTGADAIAQIQAHPLVLILMDILLPDTDGFTMLKTIRCASSNLNVPIIAVTALAQAHIRQQILDADFDGYLMKPYAIDALETIVRCYCQR
jgi:CheY-like chemotaxis protein